MGRFGVMICIAFAVAFGGVSWAMRGFPINVASFLPSEPSAKRTSSLSQTFASAPSAPVDRGRSRRSKADDEEFSLSPQQSQFLQGIKNLPQPKPSGSTGCNPPAGIMPGIALAAAIPTPKSPGGFEVSAQERAEILRFAASGAGMAGPCGAAFPNMPVIPR
jgi:hypothetical protein